ncbi:polyketide synthase [Thermothelomyces thermophilus ATCC 42464]|uniref:Polyketide synthase n=1 Tax=Thermothelomyces thermophilus (strain ATCC 42464 / BCRC 31852 / DSM 1799) TaxID=573729 RepID=G2QH37_THET4|nr:polyketide synthase [Thermothelomyces thermophilus ATCC 42464]AEO58697.1 polyketide synthase [Thermothelomyces thermophilus ATCC 42464]
MTADHNLPNGSASHTTANGINGHAAGRPRPREPIAIIGMSAKFGGSASSPSKLWDMVRDGKSAWSPIPKDRFDVDSFYHPDKDRPGRNHARGGYFFPGDIGLFDAGFFNLSADAAGAMDPQLRLLMESVYEAWEDACIPLDKVAGSETSVYTGVYGKDYHELQTRDPEVLPAAFLTGNGMAMMSNRISHFFDLQGASMTIDTGCSSGLVALHQACHSLLAGESDMAVVGGTGVILNPDMYIAMSTLGMVGADGKCYAWDARAQGYGRGEGVAALILKPLRAALRDGDQVYGVIRETGLNQDGLTKTITSPSVESQIKLIEKCYGRAGLDLADTGYVEAHMTGTRAGDLAEATALARTFGRARKPGDPVYVGSVKTNVGHTEAVSGLAAIIKTLFALKHRVIPPNINYQTPNPEIPLEEWNLAVPTSLVPWPADKALRASVNNFGYGGANAHVILEAPPGEYEEKRRARAPKGPAESEQSRIFLVSGKDQVATSGLMANLAAYVRELPDDSTLGGIARTLDEGRTRFRWLAAVRARTRAELAERLSQPSTKPKPQPAHVTSGKRPRLGFVLNGQGAQWHAMGRELIAAYPVFGDAVRRADAVLRGRYGADWSLLEELNRDAKTTRVGEMALSQPVTIALQLCLLDLLASWDVRPSAFSSHSSGEIAAAYAAGVLTFEEALGAGYYRGQIPSRSKELSAVRGGMLAAGVSREDAARFIADTRSGRVVVACVNSPESVTISGDIEAIDEVEARLRAEELFARKLKVPLAYHSHHMRLLADEYTARLVETVRSRPDEGWTRRYRYASPVTGDIVTDSEALGPEYFVRNLTSPVLFSEAFDKMCFGEDGTVQVDVVVEIGAHGTLAGPIRQILKRRGTTELPYVSTLSRNVDAVETMQNLAVGLLEQGYPVDLSAVNDPLGAEPALVYDLPKYAWNHTTRYWTESRVNREIRSRKHKPHELLGSLLPGDNGLAPTWRNFLRQNGSSWLVDHQIQGYVVLPGAGYVAMAVEAVRQHLGAGAGGPGSVGDNDDDDGITGFRLRDIEVLNALTIPDSSAGVEVQFNLRPTEKDDWYEFRVSSLTLSNTWTVNCTGFIRADTEEYSPLPTVSPDSFFHPGARRADVEPESLWADLRRMSMYHGPVFRPINSIKTARDKALTSITLKPVVEEAHDYVIHPTTLDGIFIAAYNGLPRKIRDAFTVVPRRIKGITIRRDLHRRGGQDIDCFSQVHSADTRGFDATIAVTNTNGGNGSGTGGRVSLLVDHFYAQAIPREGGDDSDAQQQQPGIISKLQWEPDLTFPVVPARPATSAQQQQQQQQQQQPLVFRPDDKQADFERKAPRVAFHLIHDAVREIEKTPDRLSPKYRDLFGWMKGVVATAARGELGPRSDTWARTSSGTKQLLIDDLNAKPVPAGRLLVRVGEKLPRILRGEVDDRAVAELVNADNLLSRYYVGHPTLEGTTLKQIARVAEQLAIDRPGATVLEIGAGSGVVSKAVLEAFGARHGADGARSVLGHYDFTDNSNNNSNNNNNNNNNNSGSSSQQQQLFFDEAAKKLAPWSDLLTFKELDIGADPEEQGFAAASYDLVVASQALHDKAVRRDALRNVNKLLKPGGTLLLVETTRDPVERELVFRVLPGGKSPTLSAREWEEILRETGFTAPRFPVGGADDSDDASISIILASKGAAAPSYPSSVSIVYAGRAPPPESWTEQLSEAIRARTGGSSVVAVENLDELEVSPETAYIFTPELRAPFTARLDEASFEKLKAFLLDAQLILWLSSGGLVDADEPLVGATNGLLRVLRQEDAGKRIAHLDFDLPRTADANGDDNPNPWTADKIDYIVEVFERTFEKGFASAYPDHDWEYSVKKDSGVFVPRAYPVLQARDTSDLPPLNLNRDDATYLVIGGMGGIGQHIAAWMMEKGARNVLIVSRGAEASPDVPSMKAMAEADGCKLAIRSCDVTDARAFADLLAWAASSSAGGGGLPPIRGVVNAAMVLRNSVLDHMSYALWRSGIRVKVDGSSNAHALLLPPPDLDFFVQLSSAVGVPGHPSQAHYAAGNTFQDALARHRAVRGLPAVTLDLTAIEGVGWMAQQGDEEAQQEVVRRIRKVGLSPAGIDLVMDLVEAAIRDPLRASAADSQVVVGLSTYASIPDGSVTKADRRFGTLRLATKRAVAGADDDAAGGAAASGSGGGGKDGVAELLRAAADGSISRAEAAPLVVDAVAARTAAIFNLGRDEIDGGRPLSGYGVDSLVAVELRNWLVGCLKAKVSIFDILQSPSLDDFGALLVEKSELLKGLA